MASDAQPPAIVTDLTAAYYAADAQASRYARIKARFVELFGVEPSFYARAPGRVNIIGEHIDYSGYGVLPMAIEQDVVIACATNVITANANRNTLIIGNTNGDAFPTRTYAADVATVDNTKHEWSNYVLAGYIGVLEDFKVTAPLGLNLVLDGTVPGGSGLSSSSAIVCCAALAALHANTLSASKASLATLCAKSERYVGTEGGGMDQSISYLADRGAAKYIQFNPIRAETVRLPNGAAFVISNSLVEANKYVTAGTQFNLRVVECRTAAKVLAKLSGGVDFRTVRTLGDLQTKLGRSLRQMVDMTAQLREEAYSRADVTALLGLSDEEFVSECLSPSTKDAQMFNLRKRSRHVYAEAERVLLFKQVCENPSADSLQELGRLMNESQASCSVDYACSCELDQLTSLCRELGALGSRLTGAGWGGCAVSLVAVDRVDDFVKNVSRLYYENDERRARLVKTALFATQPGSGACVITL
eukprot:Opistho-2@84145